MPHAKRRIVLAVTLAEHGGVQEFLLRFAKYLQEQGHEVVLAAGEGEWLFKKAAEHDIPTHKLSHTRRALHPWHDLQAVVELKRYLKAFKPDAVHLNSSKMGAVGSLAGHLAHTPRIVYRIGGWVFLEPLAPLTRWAYKMIEKISSRWKDIIICVHPNDAEIAKSCGITPRKQLVSIPNGIDLPTFETNLLSREQARQELSLAPDDFVFGTIANLFPAKDLPRYLEACRIVNDHNPHTKFIIVGEGEERSTIEEKQHALGLDKAVLLPGQKPNASRLLKGLDAFVLPSAKEGMSWALLEAMAARLPCVATSVGANEWLLQNNAGWTVPPQNPQALAEAMQHVLAHPDEARARAERAYARVQADFPLTKTLQDNEKTLII